MLRIVFGIQSAFDASWDDENKEAPVYPRCRVLWTHSMPLDGHYLPCLSSFGVFANDGADRRWIWFLFLLIIVVLLESDSPANVYALSFSSSACTDCR